MFTSFIDQTAAFHDHLDRNYMKYANEMVSNEKLRFLASNRAIHRQMMELSEDSHHGAIKVEHDQISTMLIALDAHHLIIEEQMNELSNVLNRKMERNMKMNHKHRDGLHKIAKRFKLNDHSLVKSENEELSIDLISECNDEKLKFENEVTVDANFAVDNANKTDDEMTESEDIGAPNDVRFLNEVDAQSNVIPIDPGMESSIERSDVEDHSKKTEEASSLQMLYEKGINLKCGVCHKLFHYYVDFENHMKIKHDVDKPYECHQCECGFKARDSLKRHVTDIHQKNGKYRCSFCSKTFYQKSALKMHLRIHTGDRPCACSFCDKTFRRSHHLTNHERIHNMERPYECTICGKAFRSKWNLTVHHRIHSGEKPYKCSQCHKAFRYSGHMKRHKCSEMRSTTVAIFPLDRCQVFQNDIVEIE